MAWKRRAKKPGKSKVKNAKKSSYDGKNFQSNLELYCYKELEKAEILVEYEEHTFTIFPATVYPQACYEGTSKKLTIKGVKLEQ